MFNVGDVVQRIVPDSGYGCIGTIQSVVFQSSFSREDFGYAVVLITQGNSAYAVGDLTSWFLGSMQLNEAAPLPVIDSAFQDWDDSSDLWDDTNDEWG